MAWVWGIELNWEGMRMIVWLWMQLGSEMNDRNGYDNENEYGDKDGDENELRDKDKTDGDGDDILRMRMGRGSWE